MDVILDYDGNEVVTNEICSICLENLNNPENIHELQECKHKFHSKCLITYLRTGNTFCPLCRGNANEFIYINPYINHGNKTSISAVLKYSKKNNANKNIIKMVKKYKELKKKHKESIKNLSNFQKEIKNNKEYQDIIKKLSKLRSDRWKLRQNIVKIERELSKIVMLPVKI